MDEKTHFIILFKTDSVNNDFKAFVWVCVWVMMARQTLLWSKITSFQLGFCSRSFITFRSTNQSEVRGKSKNEKFARDCVFVMRTDKLLSIASPQTQVTLNSLSLALTPARTVSFCLLVILFGSCQKFSWKPVVNDLVRLSTKPGETPLTSRTF